MPSILMNMTMIAPHARGGALRPASGRRIRASGSRWTFGYMAAVALWGAFLFDPQWYLVAKFGLLFLGKTWLILTAILAVALLARVKLPDYYLGPFAAVTAFTVFTYPFAENPAYASIPAKIAATYYILAAGTLTFVRTPRQAIPIVGALMFFQYVWWVALGAKMGMVPWHPMWGNYDGYGPLMAIGVGGAFHYGMAVKSPRVRLIAFVTAFGCVLGLVSSFARGAFLGLIAVLGWMWLNSPNKRRMTVFGLVAIGGIVLGAMVFEGAQRGRFGQMSDMSFFAEMRTIIEEAETGTGTTGDRQVLWGAAVEVFKQQPIFGVGGNNFGVAAAHYYADREIGGDYASNPAMLYDRKLHSIYFQYLSEFGVIGCLLHLWLLVDFFWRNKKLRSQQFVAAWNARGGASLDLRWVSLGLAAMMIGFLSNGLFYPLVESTLLPTVYIMNFLLFVLARPASTSPVRTRSSAPHAAVRRAAM